ncbi:DUF4253 domain-containing protein [Undibacterium amnicola]|uniref:DUF4253 domain-containing protein n=1 Tax=Undibacterium amnicola TaxID=1834038 RepID=A0ABR6XW43_9BURK|nr:DUF4253 domain-containing protein [Undibacterium amnicola]MBC3833711.1 DUF4253 domain-containing protein [Undibacterium amnicola]
MIALIRDFYSVVHCAAHHYWQKEFGAEIVGVSGDTIECIVKNPPRSQEVAIKRAWQQYWVVDQGCETIANLAAALLNAEVWYFGGIAGLTVKDCRYLNLFRHRTGDYRHSIHSA